MFAAGDWVRITLRHGGPTQGHIGKVVRNPIHALYPDSQKVKVALKYGWRGEPVDYKRTGAFVMMPPAELEHLSDLERLYYESQE